jgi:pyruvate dehydrogenase E2 component (dihydrolipoamide acetyltransferase)
MAAEIVMPRLSDSMEEGTILTWMKALGDEVKRGDELVEIETDKANMVYEADSNGTLVEIIAAEGVTLPIGETIARLGDPGDEIVTGQPTSAAAPAARDGDGAAAGGKAGSGAQAAAHDDGSDTQAPAVATGAAPAVVPAGSTAQGGRIKASPIARRIARESGIDLAGLVGSGPGGRIVKADVEAAPRGAAPSAAIAPPAPPAAPPAGSPAPPTPGAKERPETAKGQAEIVELTKLQQTVARRMAESKATAPHFYLTTTVDMTRSVAARSQIKASAGEGDVVPSFNDLVVKACAIALREFPRANGAYRDGRIEVYSRINVGVAVAGQDALVVPTVFDADLKGLRQIAAETRALAARVRDSSITPPELSGGTFTVSNLGMYGITSFAAVINPPQAGILAVGEISERPVASDGEISTAQLMDVSLACDHRILYGADGAEFLARIRALLEEPLGLAL